MPSFLKEAREDIDADLGQETGDAAETPLPDNTEDIDGVQPNEGKDNKRKKGGVLKVAKKAISGVANVAEKAGTQVASKSEEIFRNKLLMKRQMLFYGVVSLYYHGLEQFMNM